MKRILFVVSGPSGCGKTTLVKQVLKEGDRIAFSTSHTTRKKRAAEVEGRDYFFVSTDEFKKKIEKQDFAEWAEVHGHFYGTSKEEIEKKGKEKSLVLDIDIQGARQIKEKYSDAVLIFIFPPRFDELQRRLSGRGGESKESIRTRLAAARREILYYPDFDYIIINDRLDDAVQELKSIILAVRSRRVYRKDDIQPILLSFVPDQKRSRG